MYSQNHNNHHNHNNNNNNRRCDVLPELLSVTSLMLIGLIITINYLY